MPLRMQFSPTDFPPEQVREYSHRQKSNALFGLLCGWAGIAFVLPPDMAGHPPTARFLVLSNISSLLPLFNGKCQKKEGLTVAGRTVSGCVQLNFAKHKPGTP